ncbi:HesA/MoeB/ThiF family protein [Pseudoalteromonas sp. SMS1]|uniref:HesA/MoeB/ThiF family protein n=1 Tax=Pseudoalteromonas sp. SMS1 TaxID=2908894 RepID=UPI001F256090|nr:HesA/MoeB/ThiF family protein [Pseudoalteromonas sp. SMS1]MCF2858932.1 HesA/MoeB/ThiF family protein [Pseudoalteromonas sp. SMS1]
MTRQLEKNEYIRYSRHVMLEQIGESGQLKLKKARVAVIGCGGLGSPVLLYLAASGVGHLTFIDHDSVELSNLQRQILFKVNHLGQSKSKAASKVLASLNNAIELNPINAKLEVGNIAALLDTMDVIIDCSDNFATRYLVNQYAVDHNKVLVSGAAIGFTGQLLSMDFRDARKEYRSPCYACVFPPTDKEVPQNCANSGVVSPLLGVIGSMQALSVLRILLGYQPDSTLCQYDGLAMTSQQYGVVADPHCPVCGQR